VASVPAPAAALPPAAGAARAAQPAPATPLPRLALDVLVYSEIPAERLVFINGRKYVEGQTVDGETVVEQITPDGVVLDHQGRRIMLRPKLNPYARPGSP
jgi:general secretion pathway protein B